MTLSNMNDLLLTAKKNSFAVGYFEAWDMYSLEAAAIAAEKENAPIVLGFGGMTVNQNWLGNFGIEPLGKYAKKVAENLKVPASVYLNEVYDFNHIVKGIESGFNAVLFNSSHLSLEKNIIETKKVVEFAHKNKAHVQGEVGSLPEFESNEDTSLLTNPNIAKQFVDETKIDFLGVSIGNVHMHSKGKYTPNLKLLREIQKKIELPLVIHGTTGFPENKISDAINSGVAMFQVGTILKENFYNSVKNAIINSDTIDNIHDYVGSRKKTDFLEIGKNKIIELLSKYIKLFNAQNKKDYYG